MDSKKKREYINILLVVGVIVLVMFLNELLKIWDISERIRVFISAIGVYAFTYIGSRCFRKQTLKT